MGDEHDSWIGGLGVCIEETLNSVESAVGYSSDPNQGGSSQATPPATAQLAAPAAPTAVPDGGFSQPEPAGVCNEAGPPPPPDPPAAVPPPAASPPADAPPADPPAAPPPLNDTDQAYAAGKDVGLHRGMPVCFANASEDYQAAYDRGYEDGKAEADAQAQGSPQSVDRSRPIK